MWPKRSSVLQERHTSASCTRLIFEKIPKVPLNRAASTATKKPPTSMSTCSTASKTSRSTKQHGDGARDVGRTIAQSHHGLSRCEVTHANRKDLIFRAASRPKERGQLRLGNGDMSDIGGSATGTGGTLLQLQLRGPGCHLNQTAK